MTTLTSGKYALPSGPVTIDGIQKMASSDYGDTDFLNVYRVPAGTDLQAIIDDGAGPTKIYLPEGVYSGELDITRNMTFIGAGIGLSTISTNADSETTITVNADLHLQNLTVSCHATAEDAKTIVHGGANFIDVRDVLFAGHRHEPATGVSSTGKYLNTEFFVSVSTSHEVLCWSEGVTFEVCQFTGFRGIEYRDSTFNYCTFGDKVDCALACHGAAGSELTADGVATGFNGVSIFNHCQMYSNNNTFTMGYALNTTLNNCYVWGANNALYVRLGCGFLANNCTFVSSTSKALLFTGKISPNWTAANVDPIDYSSCWAYNCSFKGGDNNQYDIQVPNDADLGFFDIVGCALRQDGVFGFDPDTSLEDRNGARNYIHFKQLDQENVYSIDVINNEQVSPFITSSNMITLNVRGDDGAGGDDSIAMSLGRIGKDLDFLPNNLIVTIVNNTVGEIITLLEGNNSGAFTLTLSGGNVALATSEIAMFQFKRNSVWNQIR